MSSLPDDVLEMVIVRLPLTSLMAARCVCRKWRSLATAPQFLRLRSQSPLLLSPWLFLFEIAGTCSQDQFVHALDVADQRWHKTRADRLKGRFSFSVMGIGSDVYVVGGCSRAAHRGGSRVTHKSVVVLDALAGSWRLVSPMRTARSASVLGVLEIAPSSLNPKSQPCRSSGGFPARRRLRDVLREDIDLPESPGHRPEIVAHGDEHWRTRLGLIVLGGRGRWDEILDSGEIYDPLTDKWVETAPLPANFGPACSGATCGRLFYVFSSESDKLAAYDVGKGYWITIETSCLPLRIHEYSQKLVSCRDRLFLQCVSWCETDRPASRRNRAAVRKMFQLDISTRKWLEATQHPDAPLDLDATFASDVFTGQTIYGVEIFRIFGQSIDFVTACDVSETELFWRHISKKHVGHDADSSGGFAAKAVAVARL